MKKQLTLMALCSLVLGLGCTGENPDYCDENKPCAPGYACHLPTNSCHPAVDGGSDSTVDISTDTATDAPPIDAAEDVGLDALPDLAGDASADAGSDQSVDTVKKANGVTCAGNSECTSGICQATEKVCCDKACAGGCESCSLVGKKGTCTLRAANTVCGAADKCVDGTNSSFIEKHRCDGKIATCPKTTTPCTVPYKCANATACAKACKDNDDCTTGLCDLYDKKNTCPKASAICFVDAKSSGGSGTQASPYDTINKCLATSKVYVSIAAGTYQEALSISKKVLLVAAGVQASPFAGGTPTVKLSAAVKPVVEITAGGEVYLYGFDVTTSSTTSSDMVATSSATKTRFQNCAFHHSTAGSCLSTGQATFVDLEDVRIYSCATGAYIAFGSTALKKVRITSNKFGMEIEGNNSNTVSMEDIVATSNSELGVMVHECKSVVIDRMIASGNCTSCTNLYTAGLNLEGNTSQMVTNLLSTGNKIGLISGGCSGNPCEVVNATIANNLAEEVKCDTSNTLFLRNTIAWDTAGTTYLGACSFNHSNVKGISGGSGNLNVTPGFTNAPFDYTLKQTSPCKNKGLVAGVTLPAKDLAGKPRVVGASVDMGAYEVQ